MKVPLNHIISSLIAGTFNQSYEIAGREVLTSDQLYQALAASKYHAQMLAFINLLSRSPHVKIATNGSVVSMGNAARFAHAYAQEGLRSTRLSQRRRSAITDHLRKTQFDRDQLIYLVKNLDCHQLWELVLTSTQDTKQILTEIANDPAILMMLKPETLKILYHHLNPRREWKQPITPHLEMYYMAARCGHVLGITKPITAEIGHNRIELQTSGEYNQISLSILCSILENYIESFKVENFKPILEALKVCTDNTIFNQHNYKPESGNIFFQRYQSNQLAFIAAGWRGHTVGVTLYGRFLVLRNRGQAGDSRYGSKIYEIKDQSKMDQLITQLLPGKNNSADFEKVLAECVDINKPIVKLKSIKQKRGNCTFANTKTAIMDMRLLQEVGPQATDQELIAAESSRNYRRGYKAFTTYMRNQEVDEIIKSMFYANHEDLIHFYAVLIKEIIKEHHGKGRGFVKDKHEMIRAHDLFERATPAVKSILKQDADFMTLMKSVEEQYQKMYGVFPAAFQSRPSTRLLWDHDRQCDRKIRVEKGHIVSVDDRKTPPMRYSITTAIKLLKLV